MAVHQVDPWTRCCIACGATKAAIIAGDRALECPGSGGVVVGITHRIVKARLDRIRSRHDKGYPK